MTERVGPPDSEPAPTPHHGDIDTARLVRAKEIFLAVRALGMADRDFMVDRDCADDGPLRGLVWDLLRGDQAPLAFESLADDIRAAQRTAGGSLLPLDDGRPAPSGGDRIGNYRLLERIGEGGFGVVYSAEQERPVRRRVALKIIKLGMDTRQVVARFEAERQAIAMMDHPGIVRVFDAGSTPTGRPYFVMELVRGLPITEFCDQHRLSVRDRLELMSLVCDALQHAHQRGVIHRDIKPSNVMVATVGDKPAPKILDFGVAKAINSTERLSEQTVFTEFRQLVGTPEYMSPEQAGESGQDVDTRTDVYAAGVLLYELITGVTPFDSKRLRSAAYGELLRIIREEDPPRPSTRLTSRAVADQRSSQPARLSTLVRGELDWIVMKAMEKDRSRRYDSAGALGADLQRFLTGHAVKAAPPGVAYQVRKFVRRNRGTVLAGSLLVVALVAGLIGTSLGYFNAERQRRIAVDEKRRADASADQALVAEALATREAYSANVMSASVAAKNVQYNLARGFLDAAPERLRGWEWRLLNAKLDSSSRTLPASASIPQLNGTDVTSIMVAADNGRSLITWHNGVAHRWDARTGQLLQSLDCRPGGLPAGQGARLESASVSPDGSLLSTASAADGSDHPSLKVATWDLKTGVQIRVAEVPLPASNCVVLSISDDGSRARVNSTDRSWLLELPSGRVIAERHIAEKFLLQSSSSDGVLWARDDLRNTIHVVDARSPDSERSIPGHSAMITCMTTSLDRRWLGSAADDDTARVWDLSDPHAKAVILRHPFRVKSICFSPDASLVATTARDRALRVWDRATGELRGTFPSESPLNPSLVFMPDGKSIAAQETGGPVRFWDLTAEDTTVLRGHVDIVGRAQFVPGNVGLIISCGWDGIAGETGLVRLWDSDSGALVGVHPGRVGDKAPSLAVSRDGRFAAIAVQSFDHFQRALSSGASLTTDEGLGRTEVFDLTTGRLVYSAPSARRPEWVLFGADDRSVIMGSSGQREFGASLIHLLDADSGATILTRELAANTYWTGAPLPDGRSLALVPAHMDSSVAIARDATMMILDARTLNTIREVKGIRGGLRALSLNADGSRFATCGVDGATRVYQTDTGEQLAALAGHGMEILAVEFSSDGKRIATAGLDRNIRIWDAESFDQVSVLGGHEGHIGALDWDPVSMPGRDDRLLSCSGDSTVRIWETAPIRTRVEAREARTVALAVVEPMVAKLFEDLGGPTEVLERIDAESAMTPLERKTARQVVLRIGLRNATVTNEERSPGASNGGRSTPLANDPKQ